MLLHLRRSGSAALATLLSLSRYRALGPNFPTTLVRRFGGDALPQWFELSPGFAEQSRGDAGILTQNGKEKVFRGDVRMIQCVGFIHGISHDPFTLFRKRHDERRRWIHNNSFYRDCPSDLLSGQCWHELLK